MSNINQLCETGTNQTQTFASAPWTLPSHASLFTGAYSSKHGAHAEHKHLDDGSPTLTEAFHTNGYETVAVSNNTWISEEFGFASGFETLYKTWHHVQSDTDFGEIAQTTQGLETILALADRLTDGNPFINIANALYGKFLRKRTDDGAHRTNEWIGKWLVDRELDNPFFLFINYLEPHLEYRPSKEFAEQFLPDGVTYDEAMAVPQDAWAYIAGKSEMDGQDFEILRGLYRAELAYLDRRIGEHRTLLEDAGEWEDTVFVVTGDHGENIGDHGLMDHQYCLYDTLLHVPLVIHGGAFTDGGKNDRLVQLTDLAPTLLDAAGIDAPEAREGFQGISFHPDANTDPREYAIAEYMAPQPSMDALEKRVGELPEEVSQYDRSLRAIRSKEYKLIRGSDGSRELYHVAEDPDEHHDITDENPEIANDIETELDDWLDSFEHVDASDPVSMSRSTKDRLEDLGYLQ